jgi:F-type H+-transporting ATPase subunit b
MLDLDASLLIIFAIVWILLLVLKKVFFKPMQEVREERSTQINRNKKKSAGAQEEYEKTLAEIEEKIKAARIEAGLARDNLESEARQEKEQLLEEVSRASKDQVSKAKAELEEQMKGLLKEMEKQSELLAEKIEKRLLH